MSIYTKGLLEDASFSESRQLLEEGGKVFASSCVETQKLALIKALGGNFKYKLLITYNENKAREMLDDARYFGKRAFFYPAKDFIFYGADIHGNQISAERIRCISEILKENQEELIIVTTVDALADKLIKADRYIANQLSLKVGEVAELENLASKLVNIGYSRCPMVEDRGQFSVRGEILDIFTYTAESPVRVDFFDNEIDSIRFFDAESQRSIENIDSFEVFPASEVILDEKEIASGNERLAQEFEKRFEELGIHKKKLTNSEIDALNRLRKLRSELEKGSDFSKFINSYLEDTVSFIDYFPESQTLFVLDEPEHIRERMKLTEFEFSDSMKNRLGGGYILKSQMDLMRTYADIRYDLGKRKTLALALLDSYPEGFEDYKHYDFAASSISTYNNSFEYLAEDLKKYEKKKYMIVLVSSSRSRAERIAKDLKELGVRAVYAADVNEREDDDFKKGIVYVTYGNIHHGFEYARQKLVVITENDIFTRHSKARPKKKKYDGKAIASFNELKVGDFVVHENHGLGIYKGIEKIKVEGNERDYVKIEYADHGNLFVLATQLDRLQKYAGQDADVKPKLNKLGGAEWNKTKSKVQKAVEEVAKDLVELYAKRQNEKGYQFSPDSEWQREFEELFPYEETNDQTMAIEDTKRDMESSHIMDRLICGDVGFGKTEVAIRAAFKAVADGKQVAYLVPTTILADQHYQNFFERMKAYPITVSQLSSFRSQKQNKETVEGLKKGSVDIVVGTHRMLSKDVVFKDLGLFIIDEEQHFGVAQKEKIKKIKNNVDVLTLSATPIPRTLHMSLSGIRDMSVLEEAPVDRIPIQTFVTEHDDEIIREAISRELARNGQVFYVYNKVKDIELQTEHLRELLPEARIAYAHGQMDKKELESIMFDFIQGEYDVLVATTIIEIGMDISNVNTMIIEDANNFGLSQLYQLRGRVGRSSRTAYCFLLYRRDRMISEVAEKRLSAIREFSDLGSGFKIAMKDLEIRGAGAVLGKTQHGHMAAVGYDLYCKMLNETVNHLKGLEADYDFETTVDMVVDAYIPASYIRSEYQKLDIYKRIAMIDKSDEVEDMLDELEDRYGKAEASTRNLIKIAFLKNKAHSIGITEIKGSKVTNSKGKTFYDTKFTLSKNARIKAEKIDNFLKGYGGAVIFDTTSLSFEWLAIAKKFSREEAYIDGVIDIIDRFMKA